MISTLNDIYLIKFRSSTTPYIVTGQLESLDALASKIRSLKKQNAFGGFETYRLEGTKWKKLPLKTFRKLTDSCTDLDVILSEIYN